MNKINGVGEQFVEDINVILDEYQNNALVDMLLKEFVSGFIAGTKINRFYWNTLFTSNLNFRFETSSKCPIEKMAQSMWKL